MFDLPMIRIRGDAEAARRRQAGMRQPRKIRRLRPDAVGVGGGTVERGKMKEDAISSCLNPSP